MQADFVQRWRVRVPRYRPARECINTRAYDVVELRSDSEAKAFVETHHYSGTYPAARFRFGLTRGSHLVGVAVFSHPCNDAVLTSVFGGEAIESVELGRFVLLDDVPGNGETWFLARCFDVLRKRDLRGVVAFSDPHPRHDVNGRVVMPGHIGVIYLMARSALGKQCRFPVNAEPVRSDEEPLYQRAGLLWENRRKGATLGSRWLTVPVEDHVHLSRVQSAQTPS